MANTIIKSGPIPCKERDPLSVAGTSNVDVLPGMFVKYNANSTAGVDGVRSVNAVDDADGPLMIVLEEDVVGRRTEGKYTTSPVDEVVKAATADANVAADAESVLYAPVDRNYKLRARLAAGQTVAKFAELGFSATAANHGKLVTGSSKPVAIALEAKTSAANQTPLIEIRPIS